MKTVMPQDPPEGRPKELYDFFTAPNAMDKLPAFITRAQVTLCLSDG